MSLSNEFASLLPLMREDAGLFAKHTLTHYCRHPFAAMHGMIFAWQSQMGSPPLDRTGLRFALAAPRASAKTTIVSLLLVLHDIAFRREPYIVIISATERQARQRLRAIRREVQSPAFARWIEPGTEVRASARLLTIGDITIEAAGAGSELRGLNVNGFRPTKIILDDVESSRCGDSAQARNRIREWHGEVIEYLGDHYTHHLAIGTILHEQSLLAGLLERPDYTAHRARSIISYHAGANARWRQWNDLLLDLADERRRETARNYFLDHRAEMESGSEVLWPEKEDYEQLTTQLTLGGRRAFEQEKQNQPVPPEEAVFTPDRILHGTLHDSTLLIRGADSDAIIRTISMPRNTRRVGYLDTAMGRHRNRGDFAALAVVVILPDKTLFVERIEVRRIPPSAQVRRLFEVHQETPFHDLAIEATGFQELLMQPIQEERQRRQRDGHPSIPARAWHPTRSKTARIAALEPIFAVGHLILGPDLDPEFHEELANWPRCEHDDALDALAGAVEAARRVGGVTKKNFEWATREQSPLGTF